MFVRNGAATPGPSRECDITTFGKGRPNLRNNCVTAQWRRAGRRALVTIFGKLVHIFGKLVNIFRKFVHISEVLESNFQNFETNFEKVGGIMATGGLE